MPLAAARERRISAILRIRAAQLLLELDGRHQARSRAPKLFARIPSRTLRIAISGP